MGAWIEIFFVSVALRVTVVAPHMGAWIEIVMGSNQLCKVMSHPTWVRGLKFLLSITILSTSRRTPHGCVD